MVIGYTTEAAMNNRDMRSNVINTISEVSSQELASRGDFRGSKKSNWTKIESILTESIEELEAAIETASSLYAFNKF
jgi:hypothetical protein